MVNSYSFAGKGLNLRPSSQLIDIEVLILERLIWCFYFSAPSSISSFLADSTKTFLSHRDDVKKKMMIENSSKGYQAKQEGDTINIEKFSMAPSTSTSRQWSAFRNPRIVRVSRALGGKDRHSKVCTIRGLRDRRIRLSVPTAIQLYDLQDRLGLSQPSKVIDWLIEATKSDIDKLPPLQIPHGFPHHFHQQTLLPPYHHDQSSAASQFSLGGFYNDANISTFLKDGGNQNLLAKSRYWDIDSESRVLKGKEEAESVSISQKGKRIKTGDQENQDGIDAQKFFPIGINNSSFPGLLNNNTMTNYNSYHLEPSSLSLSQFGSHGLFPSQVDPSHPSYGSGVQFSSSFAVPSVSQFPLFTPYAPFMANSVECDPRQFNHIQILSSSNNSQIMPHHPFIPSLRSLNSPLRRLPAPFNSKLLDSDNNKGTRS